VSGSQHSAHEIANRLLDPFLNSSRVTRSGVPRTPTATVGSRGRIIAAQGGRRGRRDKKRVLSVTPRRRRGPRGKAIRLTNVTKCNKG